MLQRSTIAVVIPAYNPTDELLPFIKKLQNSGFKNIIVVNDGSSKEHTKIFDTLKENVTILTHKKNKGKGRALKTAFTYCLENLKTIAGVVTADADGQHTCEDVIKVSKKLNPGKNELILGARTFDKKVPLRSKFGNIMTRNIFHFITGQKITDSQSGLRAIPFKYLSPLIKLKGEQYEFETNMLLSTKSLDLTIQEVPIKTIYIDNNKSSHFNPILDSIKIYILIFRFISSSLITAGIDYILFMILYFFFNSLFIATIGARIVSSFLNFNLNKSFVFKKKKGYYKQMICYYLLFGFSTITTFFMISGLHNYLSFNVVLAKALSELSLFPINFIIQRDLIFKKEVKE